ncbi:MAG: beta-galactosidase [Spirochaetota bacterium]
MRPIEKAAVMAGLLAAFVGNAFFLSPAAYAEQQYPGAKSTSVGFDPAVRISHSMYQRGNKPRTRGAQEYADIAAAGVATISSWLWWNYIQTNRDDRGYQYDFSIPDSACALAAQQGLNIRMGVMSSSHNLPDFLEHTLMVDQNGIIVKDHPDAIKRYATRIPSPHSREAFTAYTNYAAALMQRYVKDNSIVDWLFNFGNVETTFFDKPGKFMPDGQPVIYDYSPAAQDDFRSYLRDVRHFSLEDIQKRYGRAFVSWDDVALPKPDTTQESDLRLAWFDFQLFRRWRVFNNGLAIAELASRMGVRSYVMNLERTATAVEAKRYGKTGAGIDITHSERRFSYILFSKFRSQFGWDIPFYCEPMAIQKLAESTEVVAAGLYHALSFAAVGYQWLGSESIRPGVETVEEYVKKRKASLDILLRTQDVFGHITGARRVQADAAFIDSYIGALASSRTFRLSDRNFDAQELALCDSIIENIYQPDAICDDTDDELSNYRILVDWGNTVVDGAGLDRIVSYVKNGGVYLTYASSGRFIAGEKDSYSSVSNKALSLFGIDAVFNFKHAQTSAMTTIPQTLQAATVLLTNCALLVRSAQPYETLATNAAGAPFMLRYAVGKGSVLLLLGTPLYASSPTRAFFENVFKNEHVRVPFSTSDRDIRLSVLKKGGSHFIVAYNQSEKRTVTASLTPGLTPGKYTATDRMQPEIVAGTICENDGTVKATFAPFELRVFEISMK